MKPIQRRIVSVSLVDAGWLQFPFILHTLVILSALRVNYLVFHRTCAGDYTDVCCGGRYPRHCFVVCSDDTVIYGSMNNDNHLKPHLS